MVHITQAYIRVKISSTQTEKHTDFGSFDVDHCHTLCTHTHTQRETWSIFHLVSTVYLLCITWLMRWSASYPPPLSFSDFSLSLFSPPTPWFLFFFSVLDLDFPFFPPLISHPFSPPSPLSHSSSLSVYQIADVTFSISS